MNNQIELFKNQLENTLSISNEQFSNNINNQLTAEKLGYQNSSNETIFKGSKFIDDTFKNDLDIIWKNNGLDFEAVKAPLFYKGVNGELIEVKDHQAIINNQNNNLLNIPKLQYTTLQLSTIKKLISEIRGNTTIESIMNVDDKRFVFNLAVDGAVEDVKQDDPHKLRLVIVSSHDSSVSCHISFIHFRMFCFNQMNKLKDSNPLVFKHTKSINDNVARINQIIDFKKGEFTKSIEDYKLMVRKEITDNQVKEVLERLYFDKWNNWTAYVDNITTAIFFVAMWLMARRKIESWIFWIIGDLITVPLYFYKGLTISSIQYIIFLILAVLGYISWKKILDKNHQKLKE